MHGGFFFSVFGELSISILLNSEPFSNVFKKIFLMSVIALKPKGETKVNLFK